MKNLLLLILSLFIIVPVFSQEMFEWTEPTAVTDSISFNSNPFVWVNGADISFMFYEKKFDNTSNSMIYQTELNGDESEQVVLADENINYRQPIFLYSYDEERMGFLIYLADLNAKFELFATEYLNDGSLDRTFLIGTEDNNIEAFNISNYNNLIGYSSDGSVYAGRFKSLTDSAYIENLIKVDSVSCYNSIMGTQIAAWEKQTDDSIALKYSVYTYNSELQEYEWTEPVEIDRTENEGYLNMDHSVFGEQFNILSWINNYSIVCYATHNDEMEVYETGNLSDPQHPSAYYWYIAVKRFFPDLAYVCFDATEGDDREIYCLLSDWGGTSIAQITNNDAEDVNPDIYRGEEAWPIYSEYVYCIWQSYRNEKVALYMSKSLAIVGSGVDERKMTYIPIDISPNPFFGSTEISFEIERNSPVILSIFTIDGSLIESFTLEDKSQSIQHFHWQPKPDLPKGTYLIKLEQDGKSSAAKVIYK